VGWDKIFPEVVDRRTEPRAEVGRGWVQIGGGRLRRAERTL